MNPSRIRVKMCGMTRSDDVAHAVRLGVDAIGLIFYANSPRYISIEKARILLKELPPFVDAVAVFVNPEKALVEQVLEELAVPLLQFHGDESVRFCQQFNMPFIKAMSADSSAHIQQVAQDFVSAHALLFDTPSDTVKGGTGVTFDWQIIPKTLAKPYILAGGLNELNVVDAVNVCQPYAVDVCSGIESSPGVKDHGKMSRFMQALWGKQ